MLAPVKFAPFRSALVKSTPVKSELDKFAPTSYALLKSRYDKSANEKST